MPNQCWHHYNFLGNVFCGGTARRSWSRFILCLPSHHLVPCFSDHVSPRFVWFTFHQRWLLNPFSDVKEVKTERLSQKTTVISSSATHLDHINIPLCMILIRATNYFMIRGKDIDMYLYTVPVNKSRKMMYERERKKWTYEFQIDK